MNENQLFLVVCRLNELVDIYDVGAEEENRLNLGAERLVKILLGFN